MKKFGAVVAFVGALGFTTAGLSAGVASAEPAVANSPGVTWKLDKPRWHDRHDHDRDWREARWDGPRYYGPCGWVPPNVSGWVPPAVC
ncbi:hypothetical protein [Mycobacterium neglectum]|uniref:hypothetical protein n=1 Tax=Mycobacterium neglectum TaxID=242737 RepID=UPI001FE37470|nr:hypothetical protein [Mycobacterium neglectum]